MQKAASLERKIILKEQKNLIKHQLSTDRMLSKIKVNMPRERRLSGPLKVIQSHTESIKSETSFSRRSSSDREKEVYSITSHTQSIVSRVSEVSGNEVSLNEGTSRTDSADMVNKLASETGELHISQMKRTLLMREAALQKRRKAAEELLQWHKKLLEEEKRITKLESITNSIISQVPNNANTTTQDVAEKYQFKGKQLNQLWFNLTGCDEKKFNEDKMYPMSQIALERFCKSAREYSTRTKKILKKVGDSEASEFSEARTDDSVSENIPDPKCTNSGSIRTQSEQLQRSFSTTNDYASDFDVESIQDINMKDMDVVDKSINQLIDNFTKIQDDISLLSIKQSQKSNLSLETDESIRSEKTESDVDISVIETARTKCSEEKVLKENNEINTSSKLSLNISQGSSRNDRIPEKRTISKKEDIEEEIYDEVVLSKNKNNTIKSVSNQSENKISPADTFDKVSSLMDENVTIEGKDNLDKSQEILEELDRVEGNIIGKISSNRDVAIELQVTNETKINLSKSEEILMRLNQSSEKSSIISKQTIEKDSDKFEDGVILELKSTNDSNVDISAETPPTEQESQLVIGNSSPEDTSIAEKSKINTISELETPIEEANQLITGNFSKHSSTDISNKLYEESETGNQKDTDSEIVLEANEVNVWDITSEKSSNSAKNKVDEISNSVSLITDHASITSEENNKENVSQDATSVPADVSQNGAVESISLSQNKHSTKPYEVSHVIEDTATSEKMLVDEISEILVSGKETVISKDIETRSDSDENSKSNVDKEIEPSKSSLRESENKSTADKTENHPLATVHSKGSTDENSSSKVSQSSISGEKSSEPVHIKIANLEEQLSENKSPQSVSEESPSISHPKTEGSNDKSQVISASEIQTTLPSKEEVNSYEEKELDSLSSSSCSQSSIPNEKEESHISEKSKSSTSEEKSRKSRTINVKKRVSEIMADANSVSRGDKSPKFQDFYTTTYDLMSPTNSPELGSPTEEYKFISSKSIFGTEAEELLRKQLAIEQEIKQITEQQQKDQLPYLFVREIPNKPPPPYTPPSSLSLTNVITIIPTTEEIEDITKYSAKILHKAYLSNNLDNISISENTLSLISKDISKECYKFVFDLCKEISHEYYKQFEKEECPIWLQVKRNTPLAVVKPLDVNGLEKYMGSKVKEIFGYEKPIRRENAIIKWSRKKRDHVDEILVMESQAEEGQWTNYDKDELIVMNEVTNEIMNMLLKETGEVFSKILSKQTF